MKKKKLKQHMLKMLKSDMVGMKKDKGDLFDGMMPSKDVSKVTVMSDSPEGIVKGLSKAEEIMKAKFSKKSESKCDKCDQSPCDC